MENNDLVNIWKKIDKNMEKKDKKELLHLLEEKAKKTVNRFIYITLISGIVSAALIAFLIIATWSKKDDLLYGLNNLLLGTITLFALFSSLFSWYKLQNKSYDLPLKEWLKERIAMLNKSMKGMFSKLYIMLIPVVYMLLLMSIHVFFENKTFIEALKNEESIVGLVIAIPIGLFVSFYTAKKIRTAHKNDLAILENVYQQLNDLS